MSVFREHFGKAIGTTVITALLGLLTTSAVYLFNAEKGMRDLHTPVQNTLDDDATELKLSKQFSDRAENAVERNNAALIDFLKTHPVYKPGYFARQGAQKDALAKAALAIQQADSDLGSVRAYADQATLIPNTYRSASLDMLRADIAVWNAVTALAEITKASDDQKSFDLLWAKLGEMNAALSNFRDSHVVVANAIEKKQLAEKRLYENQLADFKGAMNKSRLALIGVSISVIGLAGFLCFALWGKPDGSSGQPGNNRSHH